MTTQSDTTWAVPPPDSDEARVLVAFGDDFEITSEIEQAVENLKSALGDEVEGHSYKQARGHEPFFKLTYYYR